MSKQPFIKLPPNFGYTKHCERCTYIDGVENDWFGCKLYGRIDVDGYNSETMGCDDFELALRYEGDAVKIESITLKGENS